MARFLTSERRAFESPLPTVVHLIDTLRGGGTERTLVRFLRGADHALFRHLVVTFREAGELAGELPDEVGVVPIGAAARNRFAGFALRRICRRFDARIVHARGLGTWWDCAVACIGSRRRRALLSFHGTDIDRPLSRSERRKARLAKRFGARFLAVGAALRRKLSLGTGIASEEISVIPNGVDFRRFRAAKLGEKSELRARLGLDADAVLFGAVGSLIAVKGLGGLIRAFTKATEGSSEARLVLVGEGPERERLTTLVGRLGVSDRVSLVGARENVQEWLRALDVFVLPSLSEGTSNALLEARATGLPIVATNVGETPKLLDHGRCGLLVQPGDECELRSAIEQLLLDDSYRAELASAARSSASLLPLPDMISAYENLYADLLRGGSVPAAISLGEGPLPDRIGSPRDRTLIVR